MEEDLQQAGLSEVYDDNSSRTVYIRQSWNNSDLGISATETADGVSLSIFWILEVILYKTVMLSADLCGCETWAFAVAEGYGVQK